MLIGLLLATALVSSLPVDVEGPGTGVLVNSPSSRTILMAPFTGNAADGSARGAMQAAFAKLRRYMTDHHIEQQPGSFPMAAIEHYDDTTNTLSGEVAYQTETTPSEVREAEGVRLGRTPSGQLARFETRAEPGLVNPEYENFVHWISEHDLRPRSEAWEVYAKQGPEVRPENRLTYVFYAVTPAPKP